MLTSNTPALTLSIFGIPVRIEFTFFILLLLLVYGTDNAVEAGLFCFAVFIALVAHESGHAFMAKWLGCRDISISLYLGGGLARFSRTTRGRGLAITLAGPAVGLGLAAGVLVMRSVAGAMSFQINPGAQFLLTALFQICLVWNVFNLIPIHPMDGGQALFYSLSFWIGDTRAMIWVARVSMALCLLVGYFTWNFGLHFMAIFCLFFFMTNMRIHSALRDQ